jgi:hypothetical protein
MLKVASLVLDIYDDSNAEIARDFPADMHELKVAESATIADLRDDQFALVMKTASGDLRRRFPIHDEDALKLSMAYFERTKDCLPEDIQKVAEAKFEAAQQGDFSGVGYVDLEKVQPKVASFADRYWGLSVNGRDHYPLHDETLVKTAAERFPFTVDRMAAEHKFAYARNIVKRAEQLGVELPSESPIHLYSNDEVNLGALLDGIQQRKMAVSSREDVNTAVLDQLAWAAGCPLKQGEMETGDSFVLRQSKLASFKHIDAPHIISVLQQFDKVAGIDRYDYNRGLLDPFAACFKAASFAGSPLMVDGVDLAKIDPQMLVGKFDEGFVEEFNKDPVNVYKSLPDPVRALIRGLAEDQLAPQNEGRMRPEEPKVVGAGGDPSDRLNPSFADGTGSQSYA